MKKINIENWKRKHHYLFFKEFDNPFFNICANIDITSYTSFLKKQGIPFFKATLYMCMKAVNNIQEFRQRVRGNHIVEHEIIHPGFTTMTKNDIFSFCYADFTNDYIDFFRNIESGIKKVMDQPIISTKHNEDNQVFVTCIPWISFTSLQHPFFKDSNDFVPRIAWGKYFMENGKVKLPVSVQAHHALIDGVHVGKFYESLQELVKKPETIFKSKYI